MACLRRRAAADLLHLHWLELWGRPVHQPDRLDQAGIGGPRPATLDGAGSEQQADLRTTATTLLDRFFASLAAYKANGGRLVYTVHNLRPHEGEASQVEEAGLHRLLGLSDAIHIHADYLLPELQSRLETASGCRSLPSRTATMSIGIPTRSAVKRRGIGLTCPCRVWCIFSLA